MRFADLFCGIGGFRLALERAGAECVYANDNDKFACQVYRRHWDDGTLDERDIRDVESLPEVDLVTGGWPCQDLSVAGKRAGLGGERSGLFWEMMRLVREAEPRYVLFENVRGLFSSSNGRDFAAVLHSLDELGYDAAWRVCDAQYWRVAQGRRRVFVVGCTRGGGDPGEVLFESQGGEGTSATGEGERDDIATSVGTRVDQHPPQGATFVVIGDRKSSPLPLAPVRPHSSGAGHVYIACALRSGDGTQRQQGWQESVVPVEVDGEWRVRRIMPVECERLQGFPDGWTSGLSDTQRYKCLGNAVCVPVVGWIARRLMAA